MWQRVPRPGTGSGEGKDFAWKARPSVGDSIALIYGGITLTYTLRLYITESRLDKRNCIILDYDLPDNPFFKRPC
jgi:hypothetical protein